MLLELALFAALAPTKYTSATLRDDTPKPECSFNAPCLCPFGPGDGPDGCAVELKSPHPDLAFLPVTLREDTPTVFLASAMSGL
jgi:hypothetical protein